MGPIMANPNCLFLASCITISRVEIFRKLPSLDEEDKLVVSFTTTIIVFRYVLRTFAACPIVRGIGGIEGCC